ncbi:MAG: Na+/H+ antiporter NhaA [Candidatus Saccharimonadales bacterium]
MDKKLKRISARLAPNRLPQIASYLLRDEAISGKLIIVATMLALICANSPLADAYERLWHTQLSVGLGQWALQLDLRHWVNEGLMTFFFLVVGLEIKRETVKGELRKLRAAQLPIAAALGGMVVPALIYMAINRGSTGFVGWAIPMATDIAFAVGLLALVGRSIPASLKLFLLTLAIVDDIGAIIVIALFYGGGFSPLLFGLAVLLVMLLASLRKTKLLNAPVFAAIGVGLWLSLNAAGIHPSIAGAILGFLAPVSVAGKHYRPLLERLERHTIPFSTLLVVPLFAFANTGVRLGNASFTDTTMRVGWGIAAGLIVGKLIGIVGASWLMIRFTRSRLPRGAVWSQMVGVGLLAGIGFTVSIFVTELAFASNTGLIDTAKLSIFAASALSAVLGLLILKRPKPTI